MHCVEDFLEDTKCCLIFSSGNHFLNQKCFQTGNGSIVPFPSLGSRCRDSGACRNPNQCLINLGWYPALQAGADGTSVGVRDWGWVPQTPGCKNSLKQANYGLFFCQRETSNVRNLKCLFSF